MSAFFAYPSRPPELVRVIRDATTTVAKTNHDTPIETWEENDIPGRFIREPIIEKISCCKFLIADVTYYNFNVFYEIGFAIAKKKRPLLTKFSALEGDGLQTHRLSLLDSIGYESYATPNDLSQFLRQAQKPDSTLFSPRELDKTQPVFYLRTPNAVDFDIRTQSRLKKARLGFRVHDPEEAGPLSAAVAIDNILQSHGVIMHLLPSNYKDSTPHNLSMAFCAGLAHGFGTVTLIMQAGTDPVPLDYRDLVDSWTQIEQIEHLIGEFAPQIYERTISAKSAGITKQRTGLQKVNLGASSAENEFEDLTHYFLQTDEYFRILRGEVQVAAGRKGSGKTALFSQVRNSTRRNKRNIVLDLQPEGAQLLKIKEILLNLLNQGTKEHTIVAFWEYLLLLELCHKLLHKDKQVHITNHNLYEPYRDLSAIYSSYELAREGDFAERMLTLVSSIHDQAIEQLAGADDAITLTNEEITRILYKHDIHQLRRKLIEYLSHKEQVWVLFDNLDKGWSPFGVESDDILLLRCLQDALLKVQRELTKQDIFCRSTLFLRNDVLSLLVDQTPDRGKLSVVRIDWADPELLRELLRKRVVYSLGLEEGTPFQEAWSHVCISHHENEESSQYLIDRSLMRPRSLIDLVQRCLSHAVNVGHSRIEASDIEQGLRSYSTNLVDQIGFELRDVIPEAEDILYAFIGASNLISENALVKDISFFNDSLDPQRTIEYLLWYGVIGLVNPDSIEAQFIYDVDYDFKRLKALVTKARSSSGAHFSFNLGFHKGLEISA